MHVGLVRGGTALNIVPTECSFEFEFRHLPQDDPEALFEEIQTDVSRDLLLEMRSVHPGASIAFEPMAVIPTLDTDEEADIVRLAKAVTGEGGVEKVSYNCEACLFDQAGVPSVICGPGDIDQAHKPDEFIEVDQIAKCEAFMRGLMERVCIRSA